MARHASIDQQHCSDPQCTVCIARRVDAHLASIAHLLFAIPAFRATCGKIAAARLKVAALIDDLAAYEDLRDIIAMCEASPEGRAPETAKPN
jgi:hypothetical protein